MDMNDDDVVSPREEDTDIGLQASNKLDLNVEHDCRSPKASVVSATTVQSNLSSKDEANVDGVLKIGMEFKSDEHAYGYYTKYAGLVGFSVRKDWVNRSKVHGQVVSRKFTCSRQGYRRKDKRDANVKKHRKETRTGCLAHMIVTRQPDGKYRLTHVETDHNHGNVNPSNARKLQELPSLGMVDDTEVIEADSANSLEMQSKLAFQLLGRQFGTPENVDYLAIKYENHLKSGRTRDMKEGEAGHLLYLFQRQHFENPSFFYSLQLDIDDKITNIFWADDNMVVDYDHFGDVVCLDTTYRTNKDFRPFVQFIGLNHHKQVVIFGSALLYDETAESLKWLFRAFIEAMSGKKPKVILTDQDATVIQAVDSVLPEANHQICVWQMYQNALKHLSHLTKDEDSFAKDFKSCIFNHEDEEDFTHAWEAMLDKYNLQQNEWLRWMFREKEKWAVAYGGNTFFVGKNGAHLGEILPDNLKTWLNHDLDVLQFFKHFESTINQQRYKDLEASYDMGASTPALMGNVILLKHASRIYTQKAFEVFQREYEKSLNVVVDICSQNDALVEYKANMFGKSKEFLVTFNSLNDTVSCSCVKFENVGLLCSHALKVLDHRNIKVVPSRYILKRWTKDARIDNAKEYCGCAHKQDPKLITATRYKDLCHSVMKVSARAAESDKAFEFAAKQLDEVMKGVEKILTSKPSEEDQAITSSSKGANASESEPAYAFLDRNAIERQDGDYILNETTETEGTVPDKHEMNHSDETMTYTNGRQNVQPSPPDPVTSISCPPPAYISSPTPTLNPLSQGFYNFEAHQVVQCMYKPHNLAIDQQTNPNMYPSQNFYSNQRDSSGQDQLLQESLVRCTFQESISNDTELRQAMDLDAQHPHSSSYLNDDHSCRTPDTQYFGSR
ncbi:unnamed protein product [Ilex paraguariensis]|uniref:Protein FAR1-RELATED SEQUENCE n=1 Tax=Ilex paraguariensis TaxID=185542 RepID=A0ABC8QYU0_9AQUA